MYAGGWKFSNMIKAGVLGKGVAPEEKKLSVIVRYARRVSRSESVSTRPLACYFRTLLQGGGSQEERDAHLFA